MAVIGQAEARDTINKVFIAFAARESIESRRLRALQNLRLRKATDSLTNVVAGLDPDFLAVIRVGKQPIRAKMRPGTIRSFFDWLKPGVLPPHSDLPIVGALSVRPYELSRNPLIEHHFVETAYRNNEFFIEIPDLRDSMNKYGSQLLIMRTAELVQPEAIPPVSSTL